MKHGVGFPTVECVHLVYILIWKLQTKYLLKFEEKYVICMPSIINNPISFHLSEVMNGDNSIPSRKL